MSDERVEASRAIDVTSVITKREEREREERLA